MSTPNIFYAKARARILVAAQFLVLLTLFALPSCATSNRTFTFEFGSIGDNKGIEVLDYRYGTSKTLPVSAPDWAVASGHIRQNTGVYATFPPGDVLYVKWKVLSTGKVYEDRVDLSSSLPFNMNHKRIHFLIKGEQLYVYLIYEEGSAANKPDCPVYAYHHNQCSELYPQHWSNF